MRITRKHIRKLILKEMNLISEEEGDEAAAEDLFGGDEGGEETDAEEGGDEEAAAEDDAEAGDEEGEEGEEGEDEEEKPDEPEVPVGPVDDTVDTAINAVMLDFETEALTSFEQEEQMKTAGVVAVESKLSLTSLLFEAEDEEAVEGPSIDIDNFAGNVARLINNYTNLLDMEQLIFTKAQDFLTDKYGEETAREFEDVLDMHHGIAFQAALEPGAEPIAIGAASGTAVGE